MGDGVGLSGRATKKRRQGGGGGGGGDKALVAELHRLNLDLIEFCVFQRENGDGRPTRDIKP